MKDLLEILSSYNIFNYLLPGIVFVVLAEGLTIFQFVQQDIVLGVFLYYFIGLVISRLGSIVIEPILKWIGFVHFAPYTDFVSASKEDKALEVLSEANNMCRMSCSLFASLVLLKIYEYRFGLIQSNRTSCNFSRSRSCPILFPNTVSPHSKVRKVVAITVDFQCG